MYAFTGWFVFPNALATVLPPVYSKDAMNESLSLTVGRNFESTKTFIPADQTREQVCGNIRTLSGSVSISETDHSIRANATRRFPSARRIFADPFQRIWAPGFQAYIQNLSRQGSPAASSGLSSASNPFPQNVTLCHSLPVLLVIDPFHLTRKALIRAGSVNLQIIDQENAFSRLHDDTAQLYRTERPNV